jgi:3-oxoacyl-[acyl-carrier protein] reductase
MDLQLKDKVAVVAGGSRGIGRSVAERLAREGCDVMLVASNAANLDDARAAVARAGGRRVEVCATDLSSSSGADAVLDAFGKSFDRCDILVNSAGVAVGGDFLDLTDATWNAGFSLKFFGAVRLCQKFWPLLKASKGAVINIAGGRGKHPAHNFMINSAVNAALMNFTKALANLGLRDDVNVNCVIPGPIRTDLFTDNLNQAAKMNGSTPAEVEQGILKSTGMRRIGEPEDVAQTVAFLVSPVSRHVMGTMAFVDGGSDPSL